MPFEWSWHRSATVSAELIAEWRELVAADPTATVFQLPEVALPLAAIDPAGIPILGMARNDEGELEGLLPLAVTHRRVGMLGVPLVRRLGTGAVDQFDLIIRPGSEPEVMASACDAIKHLRKTGSILDLRPLRVDSRLYQALCGPEVTLAPAKLVDFSIHHVMPLAGIKSWQQLTNKSVRSNVSRGQRDLYAIGGHFSCCTTAGDAPAWLEQFRLIHCARQVQLGRESFLACDRMAAGFSGAITTLVALGVAHLNAIWIGERMIAAHISLHSRDTATSYRIAFDHEFRALSPGIVLLSRVIDDAIASGAQRFDFGFGDDEYKKRWNCESTAVKALVANPRTQRYLLGRFSEELLRFTSRPSGAPGRF